MKTHENRTRRKYAKKIETQKKKLTQKEQKKREQKGE